MKKILIALLFIIFFDTVNVYAELSIEYKDKTNCFITDENELWESGWPYYDIVKTDDDVLSLAQTLETSDRYVIKTDNALYCTNDGGEYKIAENVEKASAVNDILFITKDKALWGMGKNKCGILGSDPWIPKDKPVKIMDNVRDVYNFGSQVMAITCDNELYAWGANPYNCFAENDMSTCTPVKLMDNVTDVADIGIREDFFHPDMRLSEAMDTDYQHFITMNTDNELYLWGINKDGKSASADNVPITRKCIKLSDNVRCFNDCISTVFFIDSSNNLYCMGKNLFNVMGDGRVFSLEPVKIETDVKEAAIFSGFILILKNSGQLTRYYTLYDEINIFLKVGLNKDQPMDNVKQIILPPRDSFTPVAFVICNDNTIWGMGNNFWNGLGIPNRAGEYVYEPVKCDFLNYLNDTYTFDVNTDTGLQVPDILNVKNIRILLFILLILLILFMLLKLFHKHGKRIG